jgi:hypothetical protein
MSTYLPDITLDHQRVEEVGSFETFNGNTCFRTIDLTLFGNRLASDAVSAGRPVPAPEAIGAALADEIQRLADECGPNARLKLQILYHFSPKPLLGPPGTPDWQMQASIKAALDALLDRQEGRLVKLILAACFSDTRDRQLVDCALKLPSVTHVVTAGDIIFLIPGTLCGGDEGYRDRPVDVTVWGRGGNEGEQVGRRSRIKKDQQVDLQTMTVQPRGTAPIGTCPTAHTVRGAGRVRIGTMSRSKARTRVTQLAGTGVGQEYSRGVARNEALDAMAAFACPNPQCTDKTLTDLRVSETFAIETTLIRWLFGSWIVYADYTWSADFSCS